MAKRRSITVTVQKTGPSWVITAQGGGNDLLSKVGDAITKACTALDVAVINASPAFPDLKEKPKRKRKAKENEESAVAA